MGKLIISMAIREAERPKSRWRGPWGDLQQNLRDPGKIWKNHGQKMIQTWIIQSSHPIMGKHGKSWIKYDEIIPKSSHIMQWYGNRMSKIIQ